MAVRVPTARLRALQWIAERQPVGLFDASGPGPSLKFIRRLEKEGDVEVAGSEPGTSIVRLTLYRLSAQGAAKLPPPEPEDIGRAAVHHLQTMYPAALAAVPASAATSLRNFINGRVKLALGSQREVET